LLAGGLDKGFGELAREAELFKRQAFAESTKRSYRSQISAFLHFCLYFNRSSVPVSQEKLKCYVAFLARSLNPSSIGGYLNVVRILHVEANLPNPLDKNWEVAMIKRGIQRKLGRPPMQKLPITVDVLKAIFELLDMTENGDLSFWAASLVCFYGLLRKNTLLPVSVNSGSSVFLVRGDVCNLCKSSCHLHLDYVLHIIGYTSNIIISMVLQNM
jgi:hypothetical protein